MNWFDAVLLGIVEGITEFLPVSSTGHLTITERLLGMELEDNVGLTAFTAIIQTGAILAAVLYFWKDIVRIVVAWARGLGNAQRRTDPDYRLGWGVIIGTIPAVVVGLLFKDTIETTLRNLWFVVAGLVIWSFVLWLGDRAKHLDRGEKQVTAMDMLIMGVWQCIAMVPGVSRSGATISGGLFRGIDRYTATKLSFYLGIPALLGAGVLEAVTVAPDVSRTVGWGPTLLATAVSFVVAYATIAWLLRFVQSNKFTAFIVYRLAAAAVVAALILTGVVPAA